MSSQSQGIRFILSIYKPDFSELAPRSSRHFLAHPVTLEVQPLFNKFQLSGPVSEMLSCCEIPISLTHSYERSLLWNSVSFLVINSESLDTIGKILQHAEYKTIFSLGLLLTDLIPLCVTADDGRINTKPTPTCHN